jgi:hypothetical protein
VRAGTQAHTPFSLISDVRLVCSCVPASTREAP